MIFEKYLKYAEALFTEIQNNTDDPRAPLIYKIEICDIGDEEYKVYIGKASKGIIRPMKHYPKFVSNYENNVYRKTYKNGSIVGKRPSWRKKVHIPLSEARKHGYKIRLTMFNVELSKINMLEKKLINECLSMYGTRKILNTIK